MRVVISQPMYFPWAGFMGQLSLADVIIWLDDVQFSKGSFTNRVQLKTSNGRTWMSVPLVGKGSGVVISDLVMADMSTPSRHQTSLYNALGEAPYWQDVSRVFENSWSEKKSLLDTLIGSAEGLANAIGFSLSKTYLASQLNVEGSGSSRVLGLVKAVSGTSYITGHGAKNYLDHNAFESAGVPVYYIDYTADTWPQYYGEFSPYVTALDMVAHTPIQSRVAHLPTKLHHWQTLIR